MIIKRFWDDGKIIRGIVNEENERNKYISDN